MVDPKDIKLFVATPVFGGCTHNYEGSCGPVGAMFACRYVPLQRTSFWYGTSVNDHPLNNPSNCAAG
jgi:hypothetical protein